MPLSYICVGFTHGHSSALNIRSYLFFFAMEENCLVGSDELFEEI